MSSSSIQLRIGDGKYDIKSDTANEEKNCQNNVYISNKCIPDFDVWHDTYISVA